MPTIQGTKALHFGLCYQWEFSTVVNLICKVVFDPWAEYNVAWIWSNIQINFSACFYRVLGAITLNYVINFCKYFKHNIVLLYANNIIHSNILHFVSKYQNSMLWLAIFFFDESKLYAYYANKWIQKSIINLTHNLYSSVEKLTDKIDGMFDKLQSKGTQSLHSL